MGTVYTPNIMILAQAVIKIFCWQGSIGLQCVSRKMEITQPNIHRILWKVNQVIYILDTICVSNIMVLLGPKAIQLLIIDQIYPNREPHNFPLVRLNLYTKINCCCYTHTDVSSAKIFCMDFTAENKNIYNLHGWQLYVTNKTRSPFAAYNGDKIINWWKIGLIILSASPG